MGCMHALLGSIAARCCVQALLPVMLQPLGCMCLSWGLCRWVWVGIGALIVANLVFHAVLITAAATLGPYGSATNLQTEESLAAREYAKHGGPGGPDVQVQMDQVRTRSIRC